MAKMESYNVERARKVFERVWWDPNSTKEQIEAARQRYLTELNNGE